VDLDAIIFNPISSTILKSRFKVVSWRRDFSALHSNGLELFLFLQLEFLFECNKNKSLEQIYILPE
jgi:hypothetical protein